MEESTVRIENAFRIIGVGVVVVGTVTDGVLKPGMKVTIRGRTMSVKTIEKSHRQLNEAWRGQSIGFSLHRGDYDLVKGVIGTEVRFSA